MFHATSLRCIAPRVLAHAQRVLGDGQRWCATCHCAVRADGFEQHQGSPSHKRAVTAVRRIRGQALELWERHRAVAALEAARLGDGPTARAARAAFPPSSDPAAPTLTPSSMSAEAYPPRRRRIFDSQFRHAGTVTHSTPSGLHPLSPAAESRADATARANWRVVAAAEAAREPRVLKAHQVERAGEDAVQLSGAANAVSPRRRGAPTYWASRH